MAVLQTTRLTLSPCRPDDRADFIDLELVEEIDDVERVPKISSLFEAARFDNRAVLNQETRYDPGNQHSDFPQCAQDSPMVRIIHDHPANPLETSRASAGAMGRSGYLLT